MLKQQQASGPKSFSDMLKQQTPDQAPKSFADLLKEQSEEKPSFASMLKSHKKNDEEEEVCVEEEPEEEFGDRPLPVPLETIATGEEDETNLFTVIPSH
jgi:predicted CopG family antitoxin